MGRAHNHQAADIAVRRDIADFGTTPRTDEPCTPELAVAHAEAWRRGLWQTSRKAHHHKVCSWVATTWTPSSWKRPLRRWRNKFKEDIFEVAFVQCNAKLPCICEGQEDMT